MIFYDILTQLPATLSKVTQSLRTEAEDYQYVRFTPTTNVIQLPQVKCHLWSDNFKIFFSCSDL